MSNFSIVEYFAEHEGYRCGYCKSPNTNYSHGLWAHSLDVQDYQDLIDRGWRRSGKYCYKPTMNVTCCPMYTIRCSVLDFKLSKSQKKVLKKVNNFLVYGKRPEADSHPKSSPEKDDSDIYDMCDTPRMVEKFSSKAKHNAQLKCVDEESDQCLTSDLKASESEERLCTSPMEESGHSSSTASGNQKAVKKGLGGDPTKPRCKKAKEIRLENKRQKLMRRVAQGEVPHDKLPELMTGKKPCSSEPKSLEDILAEGEVESAVHRLRVKLVQSKMSATEFKKHYENEFQLYKTYQMVIHNDPPEKCTEKGFTRFLVKSPLKSSGAGPPSGYGSMHQQYWLDDKLIAVGVIDILPFCVSSVYLFYDPEYSFLSLGTYSALREIAFTRELNRTCRDLQYYYMGFYIHSCVKMRYKAHYNPSSLLCPEINSWWPYEKCVPILDVSKYARLDPDSTKVDQNGDVDMTKVLVLHNRKVKLYPVYIQATSNEDLEEVRQYASLVGKKCYRRMLLFRN